MAEMDKLLDSIQVISFRVSLSQIGSRAADQVLNPLGTCDESERNPNFYVFIKC